METIRDTTSLASLRQQLLSIAGHVGSARDLEEIARGLTAAVAALLPACRAYCVFYDSESSTLWREDTSECQWDASNGVIGHAARHGWALHLDSASEHPAFDRTVDDPDRIGPARMLVQPLASSDGETHALLVAIRPKEGNPFDARERAWMDLLSAFVAPMLSHVASRQADARVDEAEPFSPFRDEAIANHNLGLTRGDLVRVTPRWIAPAGWLVASLLLLATLLFALAEVDQYSTGIGIVRAGDRVSLVCRESGTLEEVLVGPGDHVAEGQVLARLDARDARADRDRLDEEFHAQLRKRMRDPSDEGAGHGVLSLRGQLEVAVSRVRQREIRAPHAGFVADVRGRPGQPCRPGDTVVTMSRPAEQMELLALLPGDDRPQLAEGAMLRFELPGYRHEYQWFRITEIGDGVIGPTEASRLLGPEVGDLAPQEGPRVVVRAVIPKETFDADGVSYAYHDGMYGHAEVRLRREPLVNLLLPGWRGR